MRLKQGLTRVRFIAAEELQRACQLWINLRPSWGAIKDNQS